MSYGKSRTKKYDKKSIELRKEFEKLSKKSKDEFSSMKGDVKTEILLREGLSKPRKMSEKQKLFQATQHRQQEEQESQRVDETDGRTGQVVLKHGLAGEQPSSRENRKQLGTDKPIDKPNLIMKGRLHEKTVPSIRADNAEVDFVMQGQRVAKKESDTSNKKQVGIIVC